MKIRIKRYTPDQEGAQPREEFDLPLQQATLLEALCYIKEHVDPTLTFGSGCRSGVCGCCAVVVEGRQRLACSCKIQDGDHVEPLRNMSTIRDLVVDMEPALATLSRAKTWLIPASGAAAMSIEDEKRTELQSDCILCGSCFSACPVFGYKKDFLGPFALTRSWRYVADAREGNIQEKIDAVQQGGIWDCTLCGECIAACPQGIMPKNDILMLRSKSAQFGYMDPGFGSFGGFGFDTSFQF